MEASHTHIKRGAIWRKWDLHIHPPEISDNGNYKSFIKNLGKSDAEVIGINDYCSIDGYKKILAEGGVPDKVIFPVVELRMNNVIANRKSKTPTDSGVRINFHLIFDNQPDLLEKIDNWLNSLDCYDQSGTITQLGVIIKSQIDKLTFDFENTIKSLNKYGLRDKVLIWLPYDEYGGIDDINPNDNFFKLSLIKKSDVIGSSTDSQIAFFKWQDKKFSRSEYQKWFDRPMPCIKGSDSHKVDYPFGKLLDRDSNPCERYCWIKADTTFEGLKQILAEPDRVFIGEKPTSLLRVAANPTKYISELKIDKTSESTLDEIWFEKLPSIPLNSELVAIIGNKGNGKSALADIIGLAGNTRNNDGFSFLTQEKFRKKRPNRSESYETSIKWCNGLIDGPTPLSINPDSSFSEKVKYIPQSYLETLCTETDEIKFSEELKKVIFSHVDESERLGKHSLDELISYKSEEIGKRIQALVNKLAQENKEIVSLESKSKPEYRSKIENGLKLKKEEHSAHKRNKPLKAKEPKKDQSIRVEQKQTSEELAKIKTLQQEIESRFQEKRKIRKDLALKLANLQKFEQSLSNFKEQFDSFKEQYEEELTQYNIQFDKIIKLKIGKKIIEENISDAKKGIQSIDKDLNSELEGTLAYTHFQNANKIKVLQGKLDAPTRKFQEYQDKLKIWNEREKEIIGTNDKQGSIKFYEEIIKYLDEDLNSDIVAKRKGRKEIVKLIFLEKAKIVELYKDLYRPVTQFITEYGELMKDYKINLDVSIQLDDFKQRFFGFISRGARGSFIGTEEGHIVLDQITDGVNFNSEQETLNFIDDILDHLEHDKRNDNSEERTVSDQLRQGNGTNNFYDFLFSLDYLRPNYKLKLGEKNISELSPGERGALLLIFYLLLDKQDIPLVIDQPEENLDNQSVYKILVKFIKEAKKKRQIIIVTHNPNLAVVCDAEQVICVKIEKENQNEVTLISGSIEDPLLNSKIVEILEGTFPAFDNRTKKYLRPTGAS